MVKRGYHHGNLAQALVEACLRLIEERGPTGFTLSEAAREAGVTPAAVYRHFQGREDLIAEAALQGYTIKLYKELEEITGMSCGLHHVGGVTLADNKDRFDMLVAERAKHRYMGLETEIIGPEEIAKIAPIANTNGIIGALYDPLDGHLDPSGTTHAYAKAARMGG